MIDYKNVEGVVMVTDSRPSIVERVRLPLTKLKMFLTDHPRKTHVVLCLKNSSKSVTISQSKFKHDLRKMSPADRETFLHEFKKDPITGVSLPSAIYY